MVPENVGIHAIAKGLENMSVRMSIGLPTLAALLLLAIGIERLVEAGRAEREAARNERLREAIAAADGIREGRKAIEAYGGILPSIPEIKLRILQREWLLALDILQQAQSAKYNRVLEDEVPILYARLEDHLESMKERCGVVLAESDSLRKEVAWRIHNLEGAARLLAAFIVLDTERNWKKVRSTLAAAVSSFQSAIETVDAAPVSNLEKNVPRWNLELLHADIYVKKLMVVQPDKERLELRDNLEAVIPEKGGYAPGNPLERRILK
jgi:hypothetical protein